MSPQGVGLDDGQLREVDQYSRRDSRERPKPVTPPGIETAVIPGLLDCVEDVAKLHYMATPATIPDIEPRSRHVIDGTVAHCDVSGQINFHGRRLFFKPSASVNQAIFHQAICGIVLVEWTSQFVNVGVIVMTFPIDGISSGGWIAHKSNAIGTVLRYLATLHRNSPIVVVDENRIATQLFKITI